jgi:hypothetical protein
MLQVTLRLVAARTGSRSMRKAANSLFQSLTDILAVPDSDPGGAHCVPRAPGLYVPKVTTPI